MDLLFWLVFAAVLAVLFGLARVYGGNIVRTYFARRGYFWAFIGEMSAVIVERFGKFYRCYLSVNLLRYAEFRNWANDRNFQFLRENDYFPPKDRKMQPLLKKLQNFIERFEDPSLTKAKREGMAEEFHHLLEKNFKGHLPFILLRADEAKDKPVSIGLPWEVSIRTVQEIEGQQVAAPIRVVEEPAPSGLKSSIRRRLQQVFTVTLDLAQRAIFVPKQDTVKLDDEKKSKEFAARMEKGLVRPDENPPASTVFYMPDVPSKDGINTALSFSIIVRPHDPYKVVYNLRYWLLTLLNEIVPDVRAAVGQVSWYAIADQFMDQEVKPGEDTKVITPAIANAVKSSIVEQINNYTRRNLNLIRKLTKEEAADFKKRKIKPAFDLEDGPYVWWNREGDDPKQYWERYPESNPGVLRRVYNQYGLYVVDVKIQDLEAHGKIKREGKEEMDFLQFLASITAAKFEARAAVEIAQGEATAIRTVGVATGDAAREEIRGVSQGIKLLTQEGVEANKAAELVYMKGAFSVLKGNATVVTGADSVLGAIAGARKTWEATGTPIPPETPTHPPDAGRKPTRSEAPKAEEPKVEKPVEGTEGKE